MITARWQTVFINPRRQTLRSGWRVVVFFLLALSLAFLFILLMGSALFLLGKLNLAPEGTAGWGKLFIGYAFLMASILIATAICLRFLDRRPFWSIGYYFHRRWWRDYLVGTGMAAAMIAIIVGIEWAAGTVSLRWSDIPGDEIVSGLLIGLAFFNLAAAFEELMFRGYPLQTLLRDLHPVWPVLITSALFGIVHAGNPHVSPLALINTVLAGVWLAVAYLKTRSLWLPTSLHWSWNWTMNSVFGLSVSGLQGMASSPLLESTQTGPTWLTGGPYGPEGGVLATIVLIVGTLVIWRIRWLAPSTEMMSFLGEKIAETESPSSAFDGQHAIDCDPYQDAN